MRPLVTDALATIDREFRTLDGPEEVASRLGVTIDVLRKAFHADLGEPPRNRIEARRVAEAKRLLAETHLRANEVAWAVGWRRDDSASRAFRRATRMTMSEYRAACQDGASSGG